MENTALSLQPANQELVKHFVSLGDNCEVGIVKRYVGDEEGDLLRWAFSSDFPSLLKALENNFEGIYQFQNLSPWVEDMVVDSTYKIAFHSKIHSTRVDGTLVFNDTEERRKELYEQEVKIFQSLKERMIRKLSEGKYIFVYKRNKLSPAQEYQQKIGEKSDLSIIHSPTDEEMSRLNHIIKSYHPNNKLLLVCSERGRPVGDVWEKEPGLYYAAVDKLAPYMNASDSSCDIWLDIFRRTKQLCN